MYLGPQEPTMTSIPAYSMSSVGSVLDWKYVTENSTTACLSNGGRCKWARGKMVSGSSGEKLHNFLDVTELYTKLLIINNIHIVSRE